jgi:hypothetical protein
MCLLERMEMVFLSQRGTVLSLFATGYISLRIAWVWGAGLEETLERGALDPFS